MTSPLAQKLARKRAEAIMSAQITIRRGKLGAFDPVTGIVGGLSAATIVYSGKARVHTISGAGTVVLGDTPIDTRQTVISIPMDSAVPRRDDIITIDSDGTADPDLGGRAFHVDEVEGGSLLGDARRMYCSSFYQSRNWSGQ